MSLCSWREMPGSHYGLPLEAENTFTIGFHALLGTKITAIPMPLKTREISTKSAKYLRFFQHSGYLWAQDDEHIMPVQSMLPRLGTIEPAGSGLCVESLVKHIVLNIVAKHATSAVLSEVRSRTIFSNANTLEALYQDVFGLLTAKDCRHILVEWADVMGKRKMQRYTNKPSWWPKTVDYKEPRYLKSHGKLLCSHMSTY